MSKICYILVLYFHGGCSSVGRAEDCGSFGPGFESQLPHSRLDYLLIGGVSREVFVEKTAKRLFNEIAGCGYKEGYESAEYDHSENDGYF